MSRCLGQRLVALREGKECTSRWPMCTAMGGRGRWERDRRARRRANGFLYERPRLPGFRRRISSHQRSTDLTLCISASSSPVIVTSHCHQSLSPVIVTSHCHQSFYQSFLPVIYRPPSLGYQRRAHVTSNLPSAGFRSTSALLESPVIYRPPSVLSTHARVIGCRVLHRLPSVVSVSTCRSRH